MNNRYIVTLEMEFADGTYQTERPYGWGNTEAEAELDAQMRRAWAIDGSLIERIDVQGCVLDAGQRQEHRAEMAAL